MKAIWFGFVLAVFPLLSVSSADFPKLNFKTLTTEDGLAISTVLSIYQDKDGFMWFGGLGNLDKYDGTTMQKYRALIDDTTTVQTKVICDLLEDSEGILWLSTYNNGIILLDKATESATRLKHDPDDLTSLVNNNVIDVYEDADRNIWMVMLGGGLSMYNRTTGSFIQYWHDPDGYQNARDERLRSDKNYKIKNFPPNHHCINRLCTS